MTYSNEDTSTFIALFETGQTRYGVFNKLRSAGGSKVSGEAAMIHHPPSHEDFIKHIQGTQVMGLSPLTPTSDNVFWAAIDIDNYPNHGYDALVRSLYEFDIPCCPCLSKSQRLHIYFFFSKPEKAKDVREALSHFLMLFGCLPNTEIYPKQTVASATASWLVLPYSGDIMPMVDKDYHPVSLSEFVMRAHYKTTLDSLSESLSNLPYLDAAYCVRTAYLVPDLDEKCGYRNNLIFNVAVYWQSQDLDDDSVEEKVLAYNERQVSPLPEKEIRETVLTGLKRKTYTYKCDAIATCNKQECQKATYGHMSKDISSLEYGPIDRHTSNLGSEDTFYIWEINGKPITIENTAKLRDQNTLIEYLVRAEGYVPRAVSPEKYRRILDKALRSGKVVYNDGPYGAGGMLYSSRLDMYTIAFFHRTQRTDRPAEHAVFDDGTNYIFNGDHYRHYIQEVQGLKSISIPHILTNLKQKYGAIMQDSMYLVPKSKVPPDPRILPEANIAFPKEEEPDEY